MRALHRETNRTFAVPAAEKGHAFVPVRGQDQDGLLSLQHGRMVANDNTARLGDRVWQLQWTPWQAAA